MYFYSYNLDLIISELKGCYFGHYFVQKIVQFFLKNPFLEVKINFCIINVIKQIYLISITYVFPYIFACSIRILVFLTSKLHILVIICNIQDNFSKKLSFEGKNNFFMIYIIKQLCRCISMHIC